MGQFQFTKTGIEGLVVVEPKVFGDNRGYFMETYNYNDFKAAGLDMVFVQDNQSKSKKGVLRGLHFQKKNPQGKLVRVVSGEVYDVAVDLRKGSDTYGKWYGVLLSAENKRRGRPDVERPGNWNRLAGAGKRGTASEREGSASPAAEGF